MADPWDPPLDLSGGYFVAEYSNGVYTHRKRLHVLPFNPSTLLYISAPGSEAGVGATATAFFNEWKVFYTSAWTISLLSVWQNVGGGVFAPCIPPVVAPVAGTNGGLESVSPAGTKRWFSASAIDWVSLLHDTADPAALTERWVPVASSSS